MEADYQKQIVELQKEIIELKQKIKKLEEEMEVGFDCHWREIQCIQNFLEKNQGV